MNKLLLLIDSSTVLGTSCVVGFGVTLMNGMLENPVQDIHRQTFYAVEFAGLAVGALMLGKRATDKLVQNHSYRLFSGDNGNGDVKDTGSYHIKEIGLATLANTLIFEGIYQVSTRANELESFFR